MRPFFGPDGCTVDGAGISSAGNPLSRAFDAMTDQHHARNIREGYIGGMRPPMGPMAGQMMDPMGKPGGDMESIWREMGPGMRPPMPMGPALGAAMPNQLRHHMSGPMMGESGFFDGPGPAGQTHMPMGARGADWAQEFGGQPGPGFRPPMQMGPRPQGPDWAMEFGGPQASGPGAMDAAFRQAQRHPGPAAIDAGPSASSSSSMSGPMSSMGPAGPMGMMGPMMMGGPMMGGPMMGGPMMGGPMMRAPMASQPVQQPLQSAAPVADGAKTDGAKVEGASQEGQMEEAFKEAQQAQSDADLGQAAAMVEMLRNSGNPKFANSQFVSFIDKVSKGDLQFKENTVIDRDGNQVDWDSLYDTAAATATDTERNQLEMLWRDGLNQADPLSAGDFDPGLDQIWSEAGRAAMEDAWRMAEGEDAMLSSAWEGGELSMENIWGNAGKTRDYKFSDDNPFSEHLDPLAEAQRLLREGRDREALMALEAEVKRNPESSEGWRQLGQLYAELDQDVEAIQCLKKGHEVDPYNLDSLLALGVSCTNELDQLPALRYLRRWIENHEEHQALVEGVEPPPEFQFEAWRRQVTELFQRAAQASPLDADVFVALGVMENINRSYDGAVQALATACKLRPNDHTAWNKLGATLANSGKSEQAVVAYHQGLQLKPNYARSWSNLAIAHANLGQHTDAARFYLSSLVLNPEATHIWSFLQSAVLNMNMDSRYAMEAIDQRDLSAATKVIDGVLDPHTLPKPKPELPQPAEEILAGIGL